MFEQVVTSRVETAVIPAKPYAIRRAGPGDERSIIELGRTLMPAAHGGALAPADLQIYLDASFNPALIARELTDSHTVYALAEQQGRAVGMVKLSLANAPIILDAQSPAELSRLYVRRELIGRGLGSALMRWAMTRMILAGNDAAWLLVWAGNGRAQSFYRRHGFIMPGGVALMVGGSRVIMRVMVRSLLVPEGQTGERVESRHQLWRESQAALPGTRRI